MQELELERPILIDNDSSYPMPAFGVAEVVEVYRSGRDLVYKVTRPTAAACNVGRANSFVFSGPDVIESKRRGEGYLCSPSALALLDTSLGIDGTKYKVYCGPVANSFTMGKGWSFELVTSSDPFGVNTLSDSEVRLVTPRIQSRFFGVAESAITRAAGGDVRLHSFNGSFGFSSTAVIVPAIAVVSDIALGRSVMCEVVDNALVAFEVC